ncbi:diguanylate cyclase domain-containing protein [Altericista sp. CCNU0014]|uniref:diguanylate cyclase domain-containing protein n=1 Tax=Altericista sp. CCNU0014 TaxID=3082949 RepID=UPI00384FDB7F
MRSVIVCVDDEWDILRSLGNQLKRCFGKDYDIELANGGEDALLLCAELTTGGKDIALIISDQKMQGIEGDVLLIKLHAHYPKALKIMLTGNADANSVVKVVNGAALYRYISKPWDATDLILTVSEALRRFQQEQQLAEQNELLKKTNNKLNSSLALLLATLEATADGILVLDDAGKVVSFNQMFASMWNLSDSDSTAHEDDLQDIILDQLIEPDAIIFQALFAQANTEKRDVLRLKDGNIIEFFLRPQQLMGETVGRVWSFRNVTREKQTEAIMKHQALYDALTNIPNRILFNQKFAAALSDITDGSSLFAIMFLDLDLFKEVNDTLGHSIGDFLLQEVVKRFNGCLRPTDVLARWGGDEFVLLLPQIHCRENASEIAHRFIEVLQPEFLLEGHSVHVTASMGIAVYPHDGLDSSTLLRNADVALYQAKKSGRNNYHYYCADSTVSN